ncbi:amidohydrolase family protein [Methylorubrum podarium]|uniref:Amidohydrolase family protein n=1 Tax=Methylorubrum podarium TaxID=200476 RepID=A0ABV1QSU8_9HYPH
MFTCTSVADTLVGSGCLCHRPDARIAMDRVATAFSRRGFLTGMAASLASLGSGAEAQGAPRAVPTEQPRPVLFTNIRLFDGVSPTLREGVQVLVAGSRIEAVHQGGVGPVEEAQTVDGAGCVLMPGLIDAHTHLIFSTVPLQQAMTADPNYLMLRAGRAAGEMLMRGFTSVRDVGGPVFGLKRAIDEGTIVGPRIWPAGAMISQTSGHGDFRTLHDLPRANSDPVHFTERIGAAAIADGTAEVLRRTREQLFLGASQIKVMAGGGVTSDHDPIDSTQYTEIELRAAVQAADDWNTYVTVHAYTPKAIKAAIRVGVRCIEHGHLADDEAAQLMAEKGVWWSLQPFLDDEDATPFPPGSSNRAAQVKILTGTDDAYRLAIQYKIKTAFGTDILFSAKVAARQGAQLAKLTRWYSPAELLCMATAGNAELLALSGPRSPYPGKLGVVEGGALADLLLVDGDPLTETALIAETKRIRLIMKNGQIYKNTL